ncbi:MAG: hypothetical protein ACNA8W_24035, partial [Bradymonadaceae bacterium]
MSCRKEKQSLAMEVRRVVCRAWMLLGVMTLMVLPATAFASPLGNSGAIADGPRLFWATVMALLLVGTLGVLSFGSFHAARAMRLLSRERELQLHRSLQVLFGALVLFAAILPYLMINFSLVATIPIVGVGGFVVLVGMWSRNTASNLEPPTSP